jgi:hypothetical protein
MIIQIRKSQQEQYASFCRAGFFDRSGGQQWYLKNARFVVEKRKKNLTMAVLEEEAILCGIFTLNANTAERGQGQHG